ncbi:MAG: alpha/beta hydrolase [Candidatus Hodarchaeales archaeon]|jgi:pimeloyl-ACP methyl ester carboxylesterase
MTISQIIIWFALIVCIYFVIALILALILANVPRRPVDDYPDWGLTIDYRVPTINGKTMECWVVYPDKLREETDENILRSNPAIILIHGWARNRGRMVSRARIYGENGYTTILFSTRDHGNSDKEITGMSIVRFSQDLESCVNWWGKPVIITGHSIGAGATLIVAGRNSLIKAVIAEASPYAFPHSLKYVYQPILKWFTLLFLPGIKIITLIKFRKNSKQEFSPFDAASSITAPTFLIHGKDDDILPYGYTYLLQKNITDSKIWLPDKTGHNIEEHPDYSKQIIGFIKSIGQ